MKKLFLLILITLSFSCLPYIDESIEHFGVKGQIIDFPNKEINIQIHSSGLKRVSKRVRTDSKGYFKIEIETTKYMTFTISGPIIAPPDKKAFIFIFDEGHKIYESFSSVSEGYFDLGKIYILPDK